MFVVGIAERNSAYHQPIGRQSQLLAQNIRIGRERSLRRSRDAKALRHQQEASKKRTAIDCAICAKIAISGYHCDMRGREEFVILQCLSLSTRRVDAQITPIGRASGWVRGGHYVSL